MSDPGSFADHFSASAETYATYRPRYPQALFSHLADLSPRRELAWDCATGSGQAAVDLAEHFQRVVATDASGRQIAQAAPHPRIDFRVAPAEQSGLADDSVDLVTVAQALHWLPLDEFYAEVRRVLRPGGILAVWCYAICTIDDAVIDAAVRRFYAETVGPYWSPERLHVEQGYRALPFPFPELETPPFAIETEMDLDAVVGYLGTWSAVKRFRDGRGEDPMPALAEELGAVWREAKRARRVRWPIFVRAGRR